jgi:hypothetical protein
MNTATIKNVAPAKNGSPAIYCQSKSGNIYKFRTPVPADRAPAIIAKMKTAGVINIAHWIKLKEGTFTPKPAKAPRPEYKEVVVKAQAARIRELQAQVFNLKAQLVDQVAGLQAEICAMAEDQAPSDAALEAIVAKQFDGPIPDLTYDLAWESEMQEEWGMTCRSPMCDELKAQEADSEVAS